MKKSIFLLSLLAVCFLFAASITADRPEDPPGGLNYSQYFGHDI